LRWPNFSSASASFIIASPSSTSRACNAPSCHATDRFDFLCFSIYSIWERSCFQRST
jgi:hypothetical protein